MIFKMTKVAHTFNQVRKEEKIYIETNSKGRQFSVKKTVNVNDSANFGSHIYYNVKNKKTGLLCDKRCDMFMSINPNLADFGQWLKANGKNLSAKELKAKCFEEAERQKNYINEKYVLGSPKAKYLDEYGECLDKTQIFGYMLNATLTQGEYQNILNHCKGDKYKAKMLMKRIKNDVICAYYNQIKKDQKIKGETKIGDIESMDNYHIEGEENPHIHGYMHAFDPVTGRYMNPRYFALAKQLAHHKIEKKYKNLLIQGIALGADKIHALEQREHYLAECKAKGLDEAQCLEKLESLVKETYQKGFENPEQLEALLAENGIKEVKANGKTVNLTFNSSTVPFMNSTAIFTIDSFNDPKLKQMLKSYAERKAFDKGSFTTVNDVEQIVKSNYDNIIKQMNDKLDSSPVSEHKRIKKQLFKVFARRLKKDGLLMDLTKQGAMSYLVMSSNNFKSGKNLTLTALKSSTLVNDQYHGKSLIELFGLEQDDIEFHDYHYMTDVPKSIRYGKAKVHIVQDKSQVNFINYELFRQRMNENYLKWLGADLIEHRNGFVLKKDNKPIMKVTKGVNDSCRVTLSDVHPKAAATLLQDVFTDQSKNLKEDEVLRVYPVNENGHYQHLRELQVKLMFSTDKNANNIIVDYPMMKNDQMLKSMIQKELQAKLAAMDKKHITCSKRIKNGSYNFTDGLGIGLLSNAKNKSYRAIIEKKINEQIIDLVTRHDVKEIKFNRKVDTEYFLNNKDKIFDMAQSLSEDKKKKLITFYKQFEERRDNVKPKDKNQIDQKQRNKGKYKH
ncbi:TPA: hypothetical protein I7114_04480 [Vibrio vulnificus]|uniref:hypothetical protein n=1 Tax=Vibrio penaeicida TaxID=104609 RepID=UPI001A29B3E5|nr:hypothetical protein [Vibrio penaeicida]HAS6065971.1 hypothetical protein [Vibrio vulnificus]